MLDEDKNKMIVYSRNYNINFINGTNYINEIPNIKITINSNINNTIKNSVIDNISFRFHFNENKNHFCIIIFLFL